MIKDYPGKSNMHPRFFNTVLMFLRGIAPFAGGTDGLI